MSEVNASSVQMNFNLPTFHYNLIKISFNFKSANQQQNIGDRSVYSDPEQS